MGQRIGIVVALCLGVVFQSFADNDDQWFSSPAEVRGKKWDARSHSGNIGGMSVSWRETGPYIKTVQLHQNMGGRIPAIVGSFPINVPDRGKIDWLAYAVVSPGGEIQYRDPNSFDRLRNFSIDVPDPKVSSRNLILRLILRKDFPPFSTRRLLVFDANTEVEVSAVGSQTIISEGDNNLVVLDLGVDLSHQPPLKLMIDLVKKGHKYEEDHRLWIDLPQLLLSHGKEVVMPENLFDQPLGASWTQQLHVPLSLISKRAHMTIFSEKRLPLHPMQINTDLTPRSLLTEWLEANPGFDVHIEQSLHTIFIYEKGDKAVLDKNIREVLVNH